MLVLRLARYLDYQKLEGKLPPKLYALYKKLRTAKDAASLCTIKLNELTTFRQGPDGVTLGEKPDTPCETVADRYERRQARARNMADRPRPKGGVLCHKCDEPKCVRGDHLFWGTTTDNMRDCVLKGRHAKQKKRGGVESPEAYLAVKKAALEAKLAKLEARIQLIQTKYTAEVELFSLLFS